MQMANWARHRMSNIRANSRVAARRRNGLSGLGIDWGAIVQTAVGYKIGDLQARRAAADARLQQAQQAAAAYVAPPPPAAYQTAVTGQARKLPLIPIAIGAAGLIGIGLLYFRKK